MLARVLTLIARVCTRLACTRRHRDRPCLHTPCLHTSSPSTSCMHPHKSAPIDALPRRVPRPWNCHPSVVEVILHRPQEPPPPKPPSPRVRDASTSCAPAHAPPSSHRRLQWPSASCTCTSAMRERDRPGGYGGRHRHCSPPPGLLPFTREEAFEAFVVRPALSKFRIRRSLINRADLGYHLC